MRLLGEIGDLALIQRAARAVAVELAAVGINLDFAPVLDVDSNPDNPVIGDRSFGRDPRTAMRGAVAFLQGLQERGVLACGKHFPGHGDTSVDSHFDLPVITHGRARLEQIELPPFRAASGAGIASMMTAHVVCEALDPGVPATLSRSICASLLRAEIGFEGVLFSDDLEMAAVAARYPIEETAVEAVWAGCDALLVCKSEDLQDRAHEALVKKAEQDRRFRDRCAEAVGRCLRNPPPRPPAADRGPRRAPPNRGEPGVARRPRRDRGRARGAPPLDELTARGTRSPARQASAIRTISTPEKTTADTRNSSMKKPTNGRRSTTRPQLAERPLRERDVALHRALALEDGVEGRDRAPPPTGSARQGPSGAP